ncbi:MAG TPA: hypothetical protein VN289_07645 [Paraburkholderia sp.]|nr:hypothetical protein [Paraburkholderia sp.]
MLLTPFAQSAHLAGMQYGEPLITFNVGPLGRRGSIGEEELAARGDAYRQRVRSLGDVPDVPPAIAA